MKTIEIIEVIYFIQLIVFLVLLLVQLDFSNHKPFKSKKQVIFYLMPCGFLFGLYNWYKQLD